MHRSFQETRRVRQHNLDELKPHSATISSAPMLLSREDNRPVSINALSRSRLVAQWRVVDGKLVCQWITE